MQRWIFASDLLPSLTRRPIECVRTRTTGASSKPADAAETSFWSSPGEPRAARHLDVEHRHPVADDAELPEAFPVLDPATQREACVPESTGSGVVVRLGEHPPRERTPVQRRQLERAAASNLSVLRATGSS